METNYAFTELPEGPFRVYQPLTGKKLWFMIFTHVRHTQLDSLGELYIQFHANLNI